MNTLVTMPKSTTRMLTAQSLSHVNVMCSSIVMPVRSVAMQSCGWAMTEIMEPKFMNSVAMTTSEGMPGSCMTPTITPERSTAGHTGNSDAAYFLSSPFCCERSGS